VTAVGGDRERRVDPQLAVERLRDDATDSAGTPDDVGDLGAHHQPEAGVVATLGRQQVEQVPLRHQGDLAVRAAQPAEVDRVQPHRPDDGIQGP
jgi:hypothetical protein